MSLTIPFFERHFDESWDWKLLSKNPVFTQEYITSHRYQPWQWRYVSFNLSLTSEFITENWHFLRSFEKPDYFSLFSHPNIDLKLLDSLEGEEIYQAYQGLSKNRSLTTRFLQDHLHEMWDWYELSRNPAIPLDFIRKTWNNRRDGEYSWNWAGISEHPSLTREFVEDNMHLFHIHRLSANSVITPEIVEEFPYESWDYRGLSMNPSIDFEYVKKNSDRPWNFYSLSKRLPEITRLIEENPGMPWNWVGVSQNPSVTLEFIQENWEKLDTFHLSANPVITPEFVESHPEQKWDWSGMSMNPNILRI